MTPQQISWARALASFIPKVLYARLARMVNHHNILTVDEAAEVLNYVLGELKYPYPEDLKKALLEPPMETEFISKPCPRCKKPLVISD